MIKEIPSNSSLNKDEAVYTVYCDICKEELENIPAEKWIGYSHYTHIYTINMTEKPRTIESEPLIKHEKIFTKDLCPECSVKYGNKLAQRFNKLADELVNNIEI